MPRDTDEWVRKSAADALGEIRDPKAVEALERLRDTHAEVTRHGNDALRKITGNP
ncbi:MAG: HEAT repeat domain-containing protein [Thermodesulfobacteriota bacterium]